MEEVPENGKKLSHSAYANEMNEWMNEVQVTYTSRNNILQYANCKIFKNISIFKYSSTSHTCMLPVLPGVLPIK